MFLSSLELDKLHLLHGLIKNGFTCHIDSQFRKQKSDVGKNIFKSFHNSVPLSIMFFTFLQKY